MINLKILQERMTNKRQQQKDWRYKIIDLTIDVLCGCTHRDKDYACKELLKQLKNMPEIYEHELGIDLEDLPF